VGCRNYAGWSLGPIEPEKAKGPDGEGQTMGRKHSHLTPKQTLLLILLPMLGTFVGQRLFLHLVRVQHVYLAGYLVHHLFMGALIEIPAAFVLAFGTRNRLLAVLAPAALGVGSAMVLDEIAYLVITQATDEDYVSAVSLWGGVLFISLAVILLLGLYRWRGEETSHEEGAKE
jgi:hypothetical protein